MPLALNVIGIRQVVVVNTKQEALQIGLRCVRTAGPGGYGIRRLNP